MNTSEQTSQKSVGLKSRGCQRHGEYQAKVNIVLGKEFYSMCPKCSEENMVEEKQRIIRENEAKIIILKKESGIPKRFIGSSLENYITGNDSGKEQALAISKQYAENFKDRCSMGCSLVFCGVPGTGKTHLACAIASYLIDQLISVKYSTVYSSIMAVKSTYHRDSEVTEESVLNSFKKPALLILDEVGVQFGTETEKMILYHIINGRYDEVLPTIMISNLPEKELTKYVGERCLDRMRENGGVIIPFDWNSYRRG